MPHASPTCTPPTFPSTPAGLCTKKVAKYEAGEKDFHSAKRQFVDDLLNPVEGPHKGPTPAMFCSTHKEVSSAYRGELGG